VYPTPVNATDFTYPTSLPEFHRMIALLWDDLDPRTQQAIYVKNLSSPNRWVLTYSNITHYPYTSGNVEGTFQLVLFESGDIQFNFLEVSYLDSYTSGLNHGDGFHYNNLNVINEGLKNYSVKFIYQGSNNSIPIINSTSVNATTGYDDDYFMYQLEYIDIDNEIPTSVFVVIDNNKYSMNKQNLTDNDYTDGVIYFYKTKLSVGNHNYSFEVSDGLFVVRDPFIGVFIGPNVSGRTNDNNNGDLIEIITIVSITGGAIAVIMIMVSIRVKKRKSKPRI
jgi:hypothetical protein